eukprot:TRINITY_DN23682_c0_g1_i1.p1 TRINITY_DN23682_c0_g1~~TRINITY_DN23682_c0_g1_i1.p1  ORF type:complete len:635 (+),score=118.26 TRINITY_DN23682_c0_g1_i1:89-1993(+)
MGCRRAQRGGAPRAVGLCAAAAAAAAPQPGLPLPQIQTQRSRGGVLDTVINFEAAQWQIEGYFNFRTRTYNGSVPAPTLIVNPGDTLRINIVNKLGPEMLFDALAPSNTFRHANSTSFHLHGLHVSPNAPEDDVLTAIPPGASFQHQFHIPADHAPGVYWYHPHLHGSTALQVMGGAVGAIIVEDPTQLWYAALPSLLLVVQFLQAVPEDPFALTAFALPELAARCADGVTAGRLPDSNLLLVNGALRPRLELLQCAETVLRLVLAAGASWLNLTVVDPAGASACSVALAARDGIPLARAPRPVAAAFIPPGGRADVILRCPDHTPAGAPLRLVSWGSAPGWNASTPLARPLAELHVRPSAGCPAPTPPRSQYWAPKRSTWPSPARPVTSYLTDLSNASVTSAQQWAVDVWEGPRCRATALPPPGGCCFAVTSPGLGTRAGPFGGLGDIRHIIPVGTTQEATFTGIDAHPIHLHTVPLQILRMPEHEQLGGPGSWLTPASPGNFEPGDWLDTAVLPGAAQLPVVYRLRTGRYQGIELVHCHILAHEDMGCMFLAAMREHGVSLPTPIPAMRALGSSVAAARPARSELQLAAELEQGGGRRYWLWALCAATAAAGLFVALRPAHHTSDAHAYERL